MANNYLQFSAMLENLTDDEAKWLEDQLSIVEDENGYDVKKFMLDLNGDEYWTGEFSHKIVEDKNCRYLWIYADENGDVDAVGILINKFLKTFRPNDCWGMTYSLTCSKPRIGEFSGGWLFVTADGYDVCTADDVLLQRAQEFRNKWEMFK